jgi:hypothetical protein
MMHGGLNRNAINMPSVTIKTAGKFDSPKAYFQN